MSVAVHPTALVDPGAQLGAGTTVGPFAIIGPDVVTGPIEAAWSSGRRRSGPRWATWWRN